MNRYILIFLIVSLGMTRGEAQDSIPELDNTKNAVFIEGFGNGLLYSLNYERVLLAKEGKSYSLRVGVTPAFSRIGHFSNGRAGEVFGLLNYMIGRKRNKLEFGLGVNNHFNFAPEVTQAQYREGYSDVLGTRVRPAYPLYNMDITSHISLRHLMKNPTWFYRVSVVGLAMIYRNGSGEVGETIRPWVGLSAGRTF